jgi:4-hydroxy-4-methyl-2-oxoglutarate aldolase
VGDTPMQSWRKTEDEMLSLAEVVVRAAKCSTPTLYEAAGGRGALPVDLKPLHPDFVICGPALPVSTPPGDNLWIHRAVASARPGEVIVIATGRAVEAGYWGEVLSRAAAARGVAGVVLDGFVRDGSRLPVIGVPIFGKGFCITKTTKDKRCAGSVGPPVRIGSVLIEAGDLVVGDGDGIVVLPQAEAAEIVACAEERDRVEAAIFERITLGESTVDIYHLD